MKKNFTRAITLLALLCNSVFAQDSWVSKADFGGRPRYGAVSFSIDTKGYLGSGNAFGMHGNDFWQYNPEINVWTQIADIPETAGIYGVGFAIGNKGYVGTGFNENDGNPRKDFWEYDPLINTWTRKADFAGTARHYAAGFSIGNKGYIGTGYAGGWTKDFWEYDPAVDTWTRKADYGGPATIEAVGVSLGNKGYIGTGYATQVGPYNQFWEYDPAADTWTRKADFPGSPRYWATGFALGTKAYIGTGYGTNTSDLWEYNPATDTWTKKADFAGTARYAATSFSIGNKGYIGTGTDFGGSYKNDFWQYSLGAITICNQTWMPENLNVSYYRNGDPIPRVDDAAAWNALTTGAWCYYNNDPSTEALYGKLYNWYAVNDPRGLAPAGWHIPNNAEWITLENCAGGYFLAGGALKETGNLHWSSPNTGATNSSGFTALPGGYRSGGGSFSSRGDVGLWWSASAGQYSHFGILFKGGYFRSLFTGSAIFFGNENFSGFPNIPISDFKSGYSVRCVKDCSPVFSICPSNQTLNAGAENCTVSVNYSAAVTGSPDTDIKYEFTGATTSTGSGTGSGQFFNKGITHVAISATNNCGTDTCKFSITVLDTIAPIVNCPPPQVLCYNSTNNYVIPLITATDNCGIKDITYTITGATSRTGNGKNASGAFNPGNSIIKWTVNDSSGNMVSCETSVKIHPKFTASIPDAYSALFGRPNTIYIGYGWYISNAQILLGNGFNAMLLVALPSGGTPFPSPTKYHYKWSNGWTTPFILISHSTPGTYSYSVTITDALGCEVVVQKTIRVIDVRCGSGIVKKMWICKPGNHQKCIYKFLLWYELLRNAEIGACNSLSAQSENLQQTTVSQSSTLINSSTENNWIQKASIGLEGRYGAIGFSIGNKGYIGLGSGANTLYKDFWEFDPSTNAWTQKADFAGTARYLATGFNIGSKGYAGAGLDDDDLRNDFWEYNPVTNTWTRKADFTGGARVYGTGFSIGNKGYFGTGYDNNDEYKNDFWEYDPLSNGWTRKADFGGSARYMATGFSIDSKGYIGIGIDIESLKNDFWEYNPVTNTWTRKADFGGTPRYLATGFRIGNRGYIGTGYDTSNNTKNDIWEYNPSLNTWMEKANFAGGARLNAASFSIGGKGYIGTGFDSQIEKNDFWEYTPSCYLTANIPDVYAVNPGGNANTLYLGYGPASVSLTASTSGIIPASNYLWSTGATTASINVSPQAAGIYHYTVTATDANGCIATAEKTITVTDIRCGNKLDKVIVCQVPPGNPGNSHEICISKNAVAAHLRNGSYLGSCNASILTGAKKSMKQQEEPSASEEILIYPNPNNGSFTLRLSNLDATEVRIIDQQGKLVSSRRINGINKSQMISINLAPVAKGIYTVQVVSATKTVTTKMIIQ